MPVGEMVAGRYQLLSVLGAGGMGQVWEAEDSVLERRVAVKAVELPLAGGDDAERAAMRLRVLREARAAARIVSERCVRVYDVVEEGSRVFLVMELVPAPTLAEVVEREGSFDVGRTAAIGLELVDALVAAHAVGIVHRDVKPRNVMVLARGEVKLADFGVASIKDDPRITTTGLVLGTPSFMSPEQARGEHPGPATDVWALGATLYYVVEGVPPFERGSALPTLNAVVHDEHRPMERAGALAPVLHSLLTKAVSARPTLAEARTMLERVPATTRDTVAVAVPRMPVEAPYQSAPGTGERTTLLPVVQESAARGEQEPPIWSSSASASGPVSSARLDPSGAGVVHPTPIPSSRRVWPVALGALAVLAAIVVLLATRPGGGGDTASSPGVSVDTEITAGGSPVDPVPGDAVPDDPQPGDADPPSSVETAEASEGEPDASEVTLDENGGSDATPTTEVLASPGVNPSTGPDAVEAAVPGVPAEVVGDPPAAANAVDAQDLDRPAGVPAEWEPYADATTGYTLWHPPDWVPTAFNDTRTDFRAPNGDYLRVDYTTAPGADPVQALREYFPPFTSRSDYEDLGIVGERYLGLPAGRSEYRYAGVHAMNFWFVRTDAPPPYGFALNFQTAESRWESSQGLREAFEAGFRFPPVADGDG